MKMLEYANSKGIPVWSELKFLEFLKAKDEASFSDMKWEGNRLTFTIHSSLTHDSGITFLLPSTHNRKKIEKITMNGEAQAFAIKPLKGYDYGWVTIKPGFTYTVEVHYADQ